MLFKADIPDSQLHTFSVSKKYIDINIRNKHTSQTEL